MSSILRLVVMIVALGVLSYLLYEPIPDGFSTSSAATVRFALASLKVINSMGYVGELIGYDTSLNITRYLTYYILRRANEKPLVGVDTQDAIFNFVRVKVYNPVKNRGNKRPGFVFIHGGGWCSSGIDSNHALVGNMSLETGIVFISVEFRLAPESPYPAGFEDCVAATKYFIEHASKYDVDPHRIAVGGDGSGGNLAAAVALRLRDESFTPGLKLQVLIYPSLQLADFTLPSMLSNSERPLLTLRQSAEYRAIYICGNSSKADVFITNNHISTAVQKRLAETFLNISRLPLKYLKGYERANVKQDKSDLTDIERNEIRDRVLSPYVSPLLAGSLKRLPKVFLLTCETDILRDEGFLYAARLKEAGVPVKHVNTELGFHGILFLSSSVPEVSQLLSNISKYVSANL